MILENPAKGTICPALYNEDYEYHLSGDCQQYCRCILTDKKCVGRIIDDPRDQSSQFFSRGVCSIDTEKLKDCTAYGSSKNTFIAIIKGKSEVELNKKLAYFE